MANIVKFPEANTNYVAEGCLDLSAYKGEWPDGSPCIISCWQLTPAELDEVNRTSRVYLHILGHAQPPVYLSPERPFAPTVVEN